MVSARETKQEVKLLRAYCVPDTPLEIFTLIFLVNPHK